MFSILEKTDLAAGVNRYVLSAPDIARKAQAGQFVILRLDAEGERIPITIAGADPERGTLTLYVQTVGKTTLQMSRLKAGDALTDLAGPLGEPSHIEKFGTVVAVGGGFGIAAIRPIVAALAAAGNRTISLLGARSRDRLILLEEMRRLSSAVHVATEDGSLGQRGTVGDLLQALLAEGEPVHRVFAVGPVVMMQAVAELTRPYRIPTVVSMNPIMMDGTGMCGACRVQVGGEMKFACVDGPEFDGHLVDFAQLIQRLKMYQPEERRALEAYRRETDPECGLRPALSAGTGGPR